MKSRLCVVSALSVLALGGSVLLAACEAEPNPQGAGGNDAVESESIGEAEQGLTCGCGGPKPGCSCLGLCCGLNNWRDLGNPGAGHCTEHVNHYCSNKGGNCGACWGSL